MNVPPVSTYTENESEVQPNKNVGGGANDMLLWKVPDGHLHEVADSSTPVRYRQAQLQDEGDPHTREKRAFDCFWSEDADSKPSSMMRGANQQRTRGSSPGCDSSNCMYCQANAQRFKRISSVLKMNVIEGRGDGDFDTTGGEMCWLRRKRSENELASLAETEECKRMQGQSHVGRRFESIWDHALLEPDQACEYVEKRYGHRVPSLESAHMDRKIPSSSDSLLSLSTEFNKRKKTWFEVGRFGFSGRGKSSSDIVCGLEFEEHGWLLASAGVSKQVRVYSLAKMLEEYETLNEREAEINGVQSHPLRVHRLSSKLSSLAWNPDKPGVVAVGDYDGVITEVDIETGHLVSESDEHAGRRIWSVSYSALRGNLMASASDSGSVAIWSNQNCPSMVMSIKPTNDTTPLTGVHLSPWDDNLIAVSATDKKAYVYDLRNPSQALHVLQGHSRPLSYVKFLDKNTIISAAIDSSLVSWNCQTGEQGISYKGHHNNKHFVGLSVRSEDGLLACGSESAEVYCYKKGIAERHVASAPARFAGGYNDSSRSHFCSAVAWQPAVAAPKNDPILASAFSDGSISILSIKEE